MTSAAGQKLKMPSSSAKVGTRQSSVCCGRGRLARSAAAKNATLSTNTTSDAWPAGCGRAKPHERHASCGTIAHDQSASSAKIAPKLPPSKSSNHAAQPATSAHSTHADAASTANSASQ